MMSNWTFMEWAVFILVFLVLTGLYFLPSIISMATRRKRRSIIPKNLLLGWTVIGWIVYLADSMDGLDDSHVPAGLSLVVTACILAVQIWLLFIPGGAISDISTLDWTSDHPTKGEWQSESTEIMHPWYEVRIWYSEDGFDLRIAYGICGGFALLAIAATVWALINSKTIPLHAMQTSLAVLVIYIAFSIIFFGS
jgi:hypothetical protein